MRLRSLCLILLVIGVAAAPLAAGSTGGSAGEKPSIDVSIGSTAVGDGDTYETGDDVTLTVNALVGTDAAVGTELSEIVVRVNGERVRSVAVNGTAASARVNPGFDNGDNSVRVIVTDDAGSVTATALGPSTPSRSTSLPTPT